MIADEIANVLQHKKEIDERNEQNSGMGRVSYDDWVVKALELLLKIALADRRQEGRGQAIEAPCARKPLQHTPLFCNVEVAVPQG